MDALLTYLKNQFEGKLVNVDWTMKVNGQAFQGNDLNRRVKQVYHIGADTVASFSDGFGAVNVERLTLVALPEVVDEAKKQLEKNAGEFLAKGVRALKLLEDYMNIIRKSRKNYLELKGSTKEVNSIWRRCYLQSYLHYKKLLTQINS